MGEIHPIGKARKMKCPICGKPSAAKVRPFCSPRCKQVDLGRWLGETYRIPSEEVPDETEIDAMVARLERGED
ncbi:DNA gyrase inhibitor YacG [Thalassobaculum sp.]|uniref:DNA gyrase inhibitor YacG n=1 Tax=Thalassobaculum sp. TaxID=2022740 RepID=UPI0032EE3B5B